MRNTSFALESLLVCCCAFSLVHCNHGSESVKTLPELPSEYAKQLKPAMIGQSLITKSPRILRSKKPSKSPDLMFGPGDKSCDESVRATVNYPITICERNPLLPDKRSWETLYTEPTDEGASSQKPAVRFFKLSSYQEQRFTPPFFCRVNTGPWDAVAKVTTNNCGGREVVTFRLSITETPEPILFEWADTWDNIPPSLTVIEKTSTGFTCSCCGIYKPCGNRCIDPRRECQGAPQ